MIRPFPKRPKPPTWRNQVTICIAAMCQHNDEARIVLCSDWKAEEGLGGSETTDKWRSLPKKWEALLAGDLSRAEELVARYESHIAQMPNFANDHELIEEMKKPAHAQKAALLDDYARQMFGIPYTDFLSSTTLPHDFVTRHLDEIARIKLGAQVILAGFAVFVPVMDVNSYLFVVGEENGDVFRIADNFAAIGSGAYVAIPVMHQREHESDKPLMQTIYTVFEAKRLSEIVPGVGQAISMQIMEPNGNVKLLSDAGYKRCNELFSRLGPKLNVREKTAKSYFEMKDEFLEESDPMQPSVSRMSAGQQ
jgi:hypothetical protein